MRVAVVNVNTFKGSQRETAKRGMTVIRLKVMVACSWKSWTKESQSWPILIWKLTFSTSLFQNSERFSFPKVVKIEVTSNRSTYETNERCSKSGNGAAGAAAPLRRLLLPVKSLFQSCSNVRTFWLCASVLPSSDYTCLFESAALWTQQQQAINVKIKTRTGKTEISWYLCDSATERRPLRIQNIAKVNKQIGLQPLWPSYF